MSILGIAALAGPGVHAQSGVPAEAISAVSDDVAPALIGSDLTGPEGGVYQLRLTFSEVVATLTADDFNLVNASITVTGTGAVYDALIRPIEPGYVSIALPPGVVVDLAGNANAEQFGVNLFDAATTPSVKLSTGATAINSGAAITVTAEFSEAVTGLGRDDVRISGGSVLGVSGEGRSYVMVVQPSGVGELTLAIPADAAQSELGIGNTASATLRLGNRVVELTDARLANFLLHRADAVLASQPGLIARFRHRNGNLFNLSAQGAQRDLTFSKSWSGGVWADLRGRWSKEDGHSSDYLFGVVGTDLFVSDRLMLGTMLQFDDMTESDAEGFVEGHGWLLGPYVAGQIGDQPLFYEARLLYGRTQNSLSIDGGDVVSHFETWRWLGSLGLAGEVQRGDLTLTPSFVLSKTSDRQIAFTDGYGNTIAGRRVDLLQGELGLDLSRTLALRTGELRVNGGGALVFSDGGQINRLSTQPVADLRGRTWFGFERKAKRGLTYSGDIALDGLGTGDLTPEVGLSWLLEF